MADSVPTCPACGRLETAEPIDMGRYRYRSCGFCGSAVLDPLPQQTHELYDASYFTEAANAGYVDYAADEALHIQNALKRLQRTSPGHARHPLLVDVGCAYGYGLDAAVAQGWQAIGIDASAHARAEARRRGHTVVSSFDDLDATDVDVVVFSQVLEHLPDPFAALTATHRLLRPGGELVIETWDRSSRTALLMGRRWQQISPPSVIHLFTRVGVEHLLARAGFSSIRRHRWSKKVSIGTVAGILASKVSPQTGERLLRSVRRIGVDRLPLPYPLDDLVLFTARRG